MCVRVCDSHLWAIATTENDFKGISIAAISKHNERYLMELGEAKVQAGMGYGVKYIGGEIFRVVM